MPPADFAAHWHAGGPAARAAAAGADTNGRDPGPGARNRDQLTAGNS